MTTTTDAGQRPPPPGLADLGPGDRSTLARCAVVTQFDAEFYERVLRAADGPSLRALTSAGLVEAIAGRHVSYRLPAPVAEMAWDSWFDGERRRVPAPLRRVAARIARECERTGRDVERLRALVLVDREAAREWFEEAFALCDERLDTAGCRNLLDVLVERTRRRHVGSDLAGLHADLARYITARELWRASYLQSERYLNRAPLEAVLVGLLAETPARALRLHGAGGHGKSTLLRWFLARHCVLNRVPCAMVDLDRVDPVNATRRPWLVALELAYQLNGQIAGAPFQELLRERGSYRAVLSKEPAALARRGAAELETSGAAVDAEDVRMRFVDALRDADLGGPLVVVVDTFEDAALHSTPDAAALVELLAAVADAVPALRVVVSGRLTAAETDAAAGRGLLAEGFRGEVADLEVPAFDPAESAAYLTKVRGVTDPELRALVSRRAGGLPWQLALWADVLETYPTITTDVLQGVQAEVAWAVDRVIGRVEDDLQWLIRYGAVPRRLHRDFAQRIVLPRIVAATSGSDEDRPDTDPRPRDAREVFRTGPEITARIRPFDELWTELLRYAAGSSWMWLSSNDVDTVTFHPAVQDPMRRMVARQPIGALLHEDATRYYEELADRDPARWAAWTSEALYHRFQLRGLDAAVDWRRALAQARASGLAERVATVAADVLGHDYVEEDVPRRDITDRPVVDEALLGEAHAELAWALARSARRDTLPGTHVRWNAVEQHVQAARRQPIGAAADPGTGRRRDLAEAALVVARGGYEKALNMLGRSGVEADGPTIDRCVARVLRADALLALGATDTAGESLRAARDDADVVGSEELRNGVAAALVGVLTNEGSLAEAEAEAERATSGSWRRDVVRDPGLRRAGVRVLRRSGRPMRAVAIGLAGRRDADPAGVEDLVEAQLALGLAADAVATCSEIAERSGAEPAALALVLAQRARARAELLDVDGAVNDAMHARSVAFGVNAVEVAATCSAVAADVTLHAIGDLHQAQQYLDEADRLPLEAGSPAWTRGELLRAELAGLRGEGRLRFHHLRQALDLVESAATDPFRPVPVAFRALAWEPDLAGDALTVLARHLPRITPARARLVALGRMDDCPVSELAEQVVTLAFPEGLAPLVQDPEEREDAVAAALALVEVLRILGRDLEAARLLGQLDEVVSGRSLLGWRVQQATARLAPEARAIVAPARPERDEEHLLLSAARSLTWLEDAALRDVHADELDAVLDTARRDLLRAGTRTTRWHALLARQETVAARRRGDPSAGARHADQELVLSTRLGLVTAPPFAPEEAAPETGGGRGMVLRPELSRGELVVSRDGARVRMRDEISFADAVDREQRESAKSPLARWLRHRIGQEPLLEFEDLVPEPVGASAPDLRVDAGPRLAQVPWELAGQRGRRLVDTGAVRHIYRTPAGGATSSVAVLLLQEALARCGVYAGPADGDLGARTRASLADFHDRHGLAPSASPTVATWSALRAAEGLVRSPTVLVWRRRLEDELASSRGYGNAGGDALEDLYEYFGWHARRMRGDPASSDPGEAVDLVHVNASMEVTGAVPYLDFGGGSGLSWSPRDDAMTVTALSRFLEVTAAHGRTPLVVLDVAARPKFGTESVRQLLLRNDFAHQLLALGHTYAVVATGLAPEYRATAEQERLVRRNVGAATAAELVTGLQRDAADGPPEIVLSRAATALFAAVGPDAMPRLGSAVAPETLGSWYA